MGKTPEFVTFVNAQSYIITVRKTISKTRMKAFVNSNLCLVVIQILRKRIMKTLKSFKKLNKAIAFVLVTVLFVTGGFVEFSKKDVRADITVADCVNNPRTSDGVSTWDCVYFGHYEQTKNKKTKGTSTCDYFKEPIKMEST